MIDRERFRNALAGWASGVTVVALRAVAQHLPRTGLCASGAPLLSHVLSSYGAAPGGQDRRWTYQGWQPRTAASIKSDANFDCASVQGAS